MEENAPQTSSNHDPLLSEHKIPVIRTYEHDIEEAIAQKKISSASISIAEADARKKEPAQPAPNAIPIENPLQFERPPVKAAAGNVFDPASSIGNRKITTRPVTPPVPPAVLPPPPVPLPVFKPPLRTPDPSANHIVPVIKSRSSHSSHSGIGSFIKLLVGIILIGGGVYGVYYLYTISPFGKESLVPAPASVTENAIIIPSIVTPDIQDTIDVSGLDTQAILADIQQKENASSSGTTGSNIMLEIIFEETESGLTTQVTAPEFIAKMGMNPPDAFISSLGDAWMFGSDGNAPFAIFTTNFFQNTFAGMLAWEPTLPEDLSLAFGFPVDTTGTYKDRILDNKNIREYVDANGTPVFLYGFIDNSTLVITRNEATFSDIVGRIEKQTYVR